MRLLFSLFISLIAAPLLACAAIAWIVTCPPPRRRT
jgi:hypothetical protein